MNADAPEQIVPNLTEVHGLKLRTATAVKEGAESLLLFSPWPESIYAYLPMWERLARDFSVIAVDLPGFGGSEGRADLFFPEAMGEFIASLVERLGLDRPHAIGPDVATPALLFAAAHHPGLFTSLVVGAGAATFPLHIDGLLKALVEAESLDPFRANDPADLIRGSIAAIRHYDVPDVVVEDYVSSYAGERFFESAAFVRNYPADLERLAPLLPGIRTPIQIVVGRNDPYGLAGDAEILNDQLPLSRLDILETGHNAWEEDPENYAAIAVDWMSGGYRDA
jgi:pimeloyl-ACP methyl ester carboxylesterase